MKHLKLSALVALGLLVCGAVHAKAPSIDYQWTEFYGNSRTCLSSAKGAMRDAGFKITGSTGTKEVVGRKGNYKGVVACFVDHGLAVFTVAGPVYKTAERYAKAIKNNF